MRLHSIPSLKQRLRVAILVPTCVALVFIAVVFVVLQWNQSYHDHEQRLRTLAQVIAEACASSLAFHDVADATAMLTVLHAESAVRDAALFDDGGKLFALYRTADAARITPQAPGPDGIGIEDRRIVIFQPVIHRGERFGTLYIRWDLRPLYHEMRVYGVTAMGLLAGSFLLALFIARVLQRSVSTPILELAQTARKVADEKNYALRVRAPDTAELNALASAFNHMLVETQAGQTRLAAEVEATRKAEEARRASEEQMRLITDATPALISYIDENGRYSFVNLQYEYWMGCPREQILGRTMIDLLGEEAHDPRRFHLQRAFSGELVHFEMDAPRQGERRWVEVHYIPHRNDAGTVCGIFVLVHDLTERKRIEDALARAHHELEGQKQKLEELVAERTAKLREVIEDLEAFSYSIAHDMRAPLRSMQGFSKLLIEDHATSLNEEGRSFLNRIVGSADRLDRLIRDVLNYSKVVRADLQLEPVDLQNLIDDIIATYPHLQSPHAEIRLQGTLPRVHGNTAALTQVISNLLGNAVKFVKPGILPCVQVRAEDCASEGNGHVAEKWVQIWIEDNGIGMPKDAQHRVFGMFQRLNRPELFEGTGIGLAIVRKAVERMGGAVGVESEDGQGSRFWVKLKRISP